MAAGWPRAGCGQVPPAVCLQAESRVRHAAARAGNAPAPKGAPPELADGEHRWGAPWHTQAALLFRRSLRTRRFQVRCCARNPLA